MSKCLEKNSGQLLVWVSWSVFFFSREKRSARENHFLAFFWFFSRAVFVFHAHFLAHFSDFSRPLLFFSRAVFSFFSREENHFSRAQNLIFFRRRGFCFNYDQSIGKTLKKTCFSNILKKIFVFFHGHFCSFTGIIFCFFSRAWNWVSRAKFYEKFHGHFCVFTCTF